MIKNNDLPTSALLAIVLRASLRIPDEALLALVTVLADRVGGAVLNYYFYNIKR